jgi:hypothetical protein
MAKKELSTRQFPLQAEVFEYLDEPRCNTAFAIRMRIPSESWALVVEVSKIGPFAKEYWVRKGRSLDQVPNDLWEKRVGHVRQLLDRLGVRLLGRDELVEMLPQGVGYWDPISTTGSAQVVNSLLFYFDGKVL